ncbi:MAG: hypothetical protein J7623_23130 [Chitinophaga sp.]|uniref:DUF7832 domain-containing protein n=1 Tax=Chitinophaga sp. TaxID=1869181 RepID=UPI001B1123F3|nr:hypothetical protein [Chitinophaga sp.]MBO9731553.1 hypothetical protein [Chitinophaga sp.]
MAKYDDASWHYGGNYPADLPPANAATHIGMFLTWCIEHDLLSEEQTDDCEEDIEKVKNRTLTGAQYLIANCDEKFTTDDLDQTGNDFAKSYYARKEKTAAAKYPSYFEDYENAFRQHSTDFNLYAVADTWENYDRIKPLIDQRFEEWKGFQ